MRIIPKFKTNVRLILIIVIALQFGGCNSLRTIGKGISESAKQMGKASLCLSVGEYPCIIGSGVVGYAEGREIILDKEEHSLTDQTGSGFAKSIFIILAIFFIFHFCRAKAIITYCRRFLNALKEIYILFKK